MAFVLVGFMGAGKSTGARELADTLGVVALDSDLLVAEHLGHSPAREFELHGEESFRAKEEAMVCELLARSEPDAVIALGGGSVLSERVRKELAGHTTVLLDVSPEVSWERVQAGADGAERPLARDREEFMALHAARRDLYDGLADAVLSGVALGGVARAAQALRQLQLAPSGTRLLWARAASGEYPVMIGSGLLADVETLGQLWPLDRERSRRFCVSDDTVAALYGERIGAVVGTVSIPAGEQNKTLTSAEAVWQAMVTAGITRADHVVAVGGGVVGDLAGFCAATYQRGVPVVQIPTTLVAQVDSAYGGKTGVDLPQAKNYIGAYHQPSGVLVDPDTLQTLSPAEISSGWVEVLKTALIAGGRLWERVATGAEVDADTIFACARTKLEVVAADERDDARRQVLNLGHTVGHAIETVTGYGRYRHGEAVGLGLLAALELSGQPQLREQVSELLRERDLPVSLTDISTEAILEAMQRDKKRVSSDVPFVLVNRPGDVIYGRGLPAAEVRAAVAGLSA